MNVLSLFDGMACGMLAMMEAGIEVDRYVAYEIDKYAVQTSAHNFPTIEHRGDVFKADFTEFRGFDFIVGGSPCTYWSIAQKNNRETEASGMGWELFSQYVRAVKEAQPMYFIYENNKSMANAIRESITQTFGFEPICINSALVSAQNRQRLYWVGKRNFDGSYSRVKVEQPEDRGILLRDVLDCVWLDDCFGVGYRNRRESDGKLYRRFETHGQIKANALTTVQTDSMVATPVSSTVLNVNPSGKGINGAVGRIDAKSRCLTTNKGEGQKIMVPVTEPVCMRYQRSDKAKAVRKQYEAGEFRHGFHELSELHPRTDGKTNTLSTVLKDNPICEPVMCGTYPNNANNQSGVTLCGNGDGMGAKTGLYAIQCCPMQVKEATKQGYTEINPGECVDLTQPNSKTRRGRNMAEKSNCLTTSCQYWQYCGVLGYATPCEWDEDGKPTKAVSGADGKVYAVYEVKDGHITIKDKHYPIKLVDGDYIIRKLTVSECMRLQTVPEWYKFPVSDSQAYKMLGNGWTVAVIAHLIEATQANILAEEQLNLFSM